MRVHLPAAEPRCRPGCAAQGATCARLQAELPERGTLVDGTKAWPGAPGNCAGYIPLSACAEPPAAPRRRVHPPL